MTAPAAPAPSLWGRVLDADGEPPPRSVVYWIDGAHDGPALPLDLHPVAWTDREGRFFAQGLPAGECLLVADCESYAAGKQGARSSEATRLTLPRPPGEAELVLRYPVSASAFATIRGQAVDAEIIRPLRGHLVVLMDTATGGAKFRQETRTDREGAFEFAWIPPGRYSVGLPGTLSRLGGGVTLDGTLRAGAAVDIECRAVKRPAGGPRFAAVVRCVDEAGAPVAGAEVALKAVQFSALPLLTGEDGVARVEGYPVPLTGAAAAKPGYLPASATLEAKGAGSAEGDLVLRRLAALRVVVLDDAAGVPLRRARIAAEHPGGVAENIDALLRPPRFIPPDGGFDLEVLPGPVAVSASSPGFVADEVRLEAPATGVPGPVLLRLRRKEPVP